MKRLLIEKRIKNQNFQRNHNRKQLKTELIIINNAIVDNLHANT